MFECVVVVWIFVGMLLYGLLMICVMNFVEWGVVCDV